MNLTATPEPEHVPPRVRLDLDATPDETFVSVSISRDGTPIRSQPYPGSSATVAFDYEAPFGAPLNYSAVGVTATYSVLHAETWGSLTGWTVELGPPSVSGSHLSSGSVTRALTTPVTGQLDSQGLISGVGGPPAWAVGQAQISIGGLIIENTEFGGTMTFRGGMLRDVSGLGSPFRAIWDATSATITTATGTWTAAAGTTPPTDTLDATALESGYFVEDFTISTGGPTPFAESTSAQLDVNEAWLIHPTFSSLSCSIDPGQHKFRDEGINVDATTKTNVVRSARSTTHEPPASRRKVVFTSGPRPAGEWDLVLRTRTLAARDRVDAICDDQSPLLLRAPQDWPWDVPDDWYSVGEYSEDRTRPRLDSADRLIPLPLTPVGEPVVRLAASWTYAADLLANSSYADARAAMPTYLDRLVGP